MNEANPILLLMAGLVGIAVLILWGLGISVTVRLARRSHRRVGAWLAAAIFLGPLIMGIACLAHGRRRLVPAWVAAQIVSLGAVCAAAVIFLPHVLGVSPALDLPILLGGALAALAPLLVLASLGPRRDAKTPSKPGKPIIHAEKLHKRYRLGSKSLHVLRGVSLSVKPGEFVAILGASGSGKSTLLHLLGLLDWSDSGKVILDGTDSTTLRPAERDRIRSRDIGFVFQFYHLLSELNVLENTLMPAMTSVGPLRWPGVRGRNRKRAIEILTSLGMKDRLNHRPRELSGGEQQRVAIARALVNSPKILLADEPTGNLDSKTGSQILALLKQLNEQTEQTIVMVTHDKDLAAMATRVLHLQDGRLK